MSSSRTTGRPALALVRPLAPEAPEVRFCGHCGIRPKPGEISPTRVCAECGLGLLLQCAENVAPKPGDPFLVLDHTLSVCAVSAAAERLLATREIDAVNVPVASLLVPAEAEGNGGAGLAAAIIWAARGDGGVTRTVVRPANTFGVRLNARIAGCGPPRAALLVFE
ncbi:MAG TPA: hypothetical protein VFI54_16585 [Solirubrobacteraceae bacterium]|nr:hypothetical protein [Solirubrobacteraceae bacterium]